MLILHGEVPLACDSIDKSASSPLMTRPSNSIGADLPCCINAGGLHRCMNSRRDSSKGRLEFTSDAAVDVKKF